jgi:hypothetical protein
MNRKINAKEAKKWCLINSSVAQYKKSISNDKHKQQIAFLDTLSTLALQRDEPKRFNQTYKSQFKWNLEFKKTMEVDEASFVSMFQDFENIPNDVALPDKFQWTLQLKNNEKIWKDWVYIAESHLAGADLGVFAARTFHIGNILGYYVGNRKYRSKRATDPMPEDKDIEHISTSPYALTLRNTKAHWVVVDVEPVTATKPAFLFMGMHYINNACLTYKEGVPQYAKAKRQQNCQINSDGTFTATKRINVGEELYCPYMPEHDPNDSDLSPLSSKEEEEEEEEEEEKEKTTTKRKSKHQTKGEPKGQPVAKRQKKK